MTANSNWQELRELSEKTRFLIIHDLREQLQYLSYHINKLEDVAKCQELLDGIKALIMSRGKND